MKIVVLLVLLGAPLSVDAAQARRQATPPASQPADPRGEAYHQFLLAQRLEDEQNTDGAIEAYKRAMALDPTSADLPAALASLYLGLDRADDAKASAEQALKTDVDNREAHGVLGTLFAREASSDSRVSRQERQQSLTRAIEHLEKASVERQGLQADANLRAMLARLYIVNTAYDKAIPLLSDLVRQQPGWQDGAGLLVDAYVSAGRTEEAIAWLEQAAPEDPQLYPTLAELYGRGQRWNDAALAYERALATASTSFDLRVRYASMLINAGGVENILKARTRLREAVKLRATDERALYLLAQAERQTHELDAAESTARKLIAQNGKNPRGFYALAEALEERQRYQEVIDELGPALPQFRTGAGSELALGMLLPHLGFSYQQLNRFDEAIATFEEARKLAPEDPTVAGFLIQANLSAKRFGPAIELARAARVAYPEETRFARLESQALRQSGKVDEGLAVLEQLLQKPANNPNGHVALAHAYVDANRGAQAVRVLQDAQAKFPSDPTPSFELGAILEKQKKFSDAEAAFKQALERNPEHAPSLNYLGYMLAERGERLNESVVYIKRALALEPDNGSYLDSLGWAYFRDGQLDLAADNLQRAAAQLTSNPVIQDHYGDVLMKLGRFQDAIDAWTRALSGDADEIDRGAVDKKIRSARQKLPKK
jgi:tetratricopeptide (TPR) repeat protein